MEDKTLYTEKSIQSLSPLEFTRLRPGVYAGSTEYSTQLLVEIVSNAIDEFKVGHGNQIDVLINTKDNIYVVRDHAQGFPINVKRDDGKTVLQAAFDTLNTSGKFSDDGVYEGTALGLNGIGSKLTNYLSHWLKVSSCQNGKKEDISFIEGVFNKRSIENNWPKNEHGTSVEWQPSEQFFTHKEVDLNKVRKLFHVLSCLCVGLTINLTIDGKIETYKSEHGLNDLVDDEVKDTEIINSRMNMSFDGGKNKLDMVIAYTSSYSSNMISYVNTGETDSGPHITQIKTIITREFNKFFKEKKWLKDKDANLSGDEVQEGMFVAFNLTAPGVAYDAQTKSRIVKIDMTPFTEVIAENLKNWFTNNEKDIKIIFDKSITARKAKEAAKKAREIVRKPKAKGLKAKMAISNKFIDCVDKDPLHRNLLLVEGLSAGSSAVEARNQKTDCIYMLRGKIISPLKTSIDKILANQEMSDIIRIIGAGFGNDKFDVDKMNFDKIVITSDQDSDGAAIELLLITFFYTYMRPLVENGKLYRAVTPLYIVRKGDNEEYFYSDEEYNKWIPEHKNWDVLRCKGLGELNATDLHKVCFEKQRFKRLTVTDAAETTKLLEILEGSAVAPRKQYIYNNAERLGFEFD